MPSFIITVNMSTEIRVNLPVLSSSIGMHLAWVGGANETDDGWVLFDIAGSEGEERVRWITPELCIGDEITITISEDPVVNSATSRSPNEVMNRRNLRE